MGLDGKKDVHLDGSSVGAVSRLEVLEGPTGRRVRSEAERARIAAESLVPGAQVSEAFFGAVRGYVEGVYVERSFRRRGVARRLMQECIQWLKAMGCDCVRLSLGDNFQARSRCSPVESCISLR